MDIAGFWRKFRRLQNRPATIAGPRKTPDWAIIARKVRLFASFRFIRGQGLEIGALHEPLPTFHDAKVRYVDSLPNEGLGRAYPEVADKPQVAVEIVDDAEFLAKISDESVDFVIANHVLEHCRDPIRALCAMLRVVPPSGIIYLAIPDKRFTFDHRRAATPYEHVLRDYREGAEVSDRQHYEEWRRDVLQIDEGVTTPMPIEALRSAHPDIHFHVWTQREIVALLGGVQRDLNLAFEIEMLAKNGSEMVVVLRKSAAVSPLPAQT
jgi:SAM-dependent methyltransferase